MPKFGWKPDTAQHIAETPVFTSVMRAQRYGVSQKLPSSVNLLGKHFFRRDQKLSSACVGFGLSGAIYARLHFLGFDVPLFSPLAIYGIGRQREGIFKNKPLPDNGCYPFLAMAGIMYNGIVYEKDWPFDQDYLSRVEQEVPFDIFQKASQFRVGGVHRIVQTGDALVETCMRALATAHPIPLGMMVGQAFSDYSRGKGPVDVETGPDIGGHETFLIGYEDNGDTFLTANSWGRDQGDEGVVRITRDKLTHPSTSDLYDFTITDQKAA